MSFGQMMGKVLSNMGPGLLGGVGNALEGNGTEARPHMPGPHAPSPNDPKSAQPNSYKHGGVVHKTGVALVHKGEKVIPAGHEETVHLSHHRVVMHLNHGGLHRALHIPEDQKIPDDKIEEGTHSKNPHLREMSVLAKSMSHWNHHHSA